MLVQALAELEGIIPEARDVVTNRDARQDLAASDLDLIPVGW